MQQITAVVTVALQEGLLYACLALGVWVSFRVLAFPDLTVDGAFPLGAATAAVLIVHGYNPLIATVASVCAGVLAGLFTALLNTRLGINDLLSGILTMTGLYSVNLIIMRGSNVALLREITVFDLVGYIPGFANRYLISIIVPGGVVLLVGALLTVFLYTQIGLVLRASGSNESMIRSLGVDTSRITWLGLSIANGLVALSGSLMAQWQGFADVGMGVGSIVIGLAAIILGERLLRLADVGRSVAAVVLGTVVYRSIISLSLRAGLEPVNLKLVTMLLLIVVLSTPAIRAWLGFGRKVASCSTSNR
jgi:putative ABC transport system permease protein